MTNVYTTRKFEVSNINRYVKYAMIILIIIYIILGCNTMIISIGYIAVVRSIENSRTVERVVYDDYRELATGRALDSNGEPDIAIKHFYSLLLTLLLTVNFLSISKSLRTAFARQVCFLSSLDRSGVLRLLSAQSR